MAEDEKRVATEILLSIESKLIVLDGRIKNNEFLLKTLLNKTNKTQSIMPPALSQQVYQPSYEEVVNKDNFENRPKTNKFSEMAASKGIAIDERPETYTVKSAENANESLRGRGQRVAKPKGPKSSVSQVLNRGNDVLFLANVEVLDANEELVSQTRTNTKGRWLMALSPGDYQVHVTKRFPPDSGKKSIDTMYQISVPSTDVPLELEPYAVE